MRAELALHGISRSRRAQGPRAAWYRDSGLRRKYQTYSSKKPGGVDARQRIEIIRGALAGSAPQVFAQRARRATQFRRVVRNERSRRRAAGFAAARARRAPAPWRRPARARRRRGSLPASIAMLGSRAAVGRGRCGTRRPPAKSTSPGIENAGRAPRRARRPLPCAATGAASRNSHRRPSARAPTSHERRCDPTRTAPRAPAAPAQCRFSGRVTSRRSLTF